MPSNNLLSILKVLPKLTADELAEVQDRINALRQIGPASSLVSDNSSSDRDLVLDVLVANLRRSGLEYCSVGMLRRSSHFKTFNDKVPEVMEYIRTAAPAKVAQRAVLDLGIELLYRYLTKLGHPVGSRTLMANIHRIPDVINQQFPGYAESGALTLIARRKEVEDDHVDNEDPAPSS